MPEKMTAEQLTSALDQFTGSDQFYRWSILAPRMILTEGVHFLCEKAGAFWLADLIASHQPKALKDPMLQNFQVWTLKVNLETSKATAICERDTGDIAITQKIPYTDFPLKEVKLWVERSGVDRWTILLPSEH